MRIARIGPMGSISPIGPIFRDSFKIDIRDTDEVRQGMLVRIGRAREGIDDVPGEWSWPGFGN
jgi:hypothetical protein